MVDAASDTVECWSRPQTQHRLPAHLEVYHVGMQPYVHPTPPATLPRSNSHQSSKLSRSSRRNLLACSGTSRQTCCSVGTNPTEDLRAAAMEERIKQMELEDILHLIKQAQADVECKLLDDQGQCLREEALREGQWNLEDGDRPFPLVVVACSRENSKGASWVAIALPTPLLICSRLCCSVCRECVSWQGEFELLHHLRKDKAPPWAMFSALHVLVEALLSRLCSTERKLANTVVLPWGFGHCVTNLTTHFCLSAWLFKANAVPNDNILLSFQAKAAFPLPSSPGS